MNEHFKATSNARIKNPVLAHILANRETVARYNEIAQEARKKQLTDIAAFALEKVARIDTNPVKSHEAVTLSDVNFEEFRTACESFDVTREQITHAWNVSYNASIAGMNRTLVGARDHDDSFIPLPANAIQEPSEGIFVIQQNSADILDVASLRDVITQTKGMTPRVRRSFGHKASTQDMDILSRFVDTYAPPVESSEK